MAFLKSHIPFPPSKLNPASCQAQRIYAAVDKPVVKMTMTRQESEMKQLAYEVERAKWRKEHPVVPK